MFDDKSGTREGLQERIDVKHDFGLCAWARHFNVSEISVKEAVAAVGDRADRVSEHLKRRPGLSSRGAGTSAELSSSSSS